MHDEATKLDADTAALLALIERGLQQVMGGEGHVHKVGIVETISQSYFGGQGGGQGEWVNVRHQVSWD